LQHYTTAATTTTTATTTATTTLKMILNKDLPKGDDILTANDIVKYGSVVFSSFHGDISIPYHYIAGIVYEADDFYTVLHSIIMACWKRASKGEKITMDELLEYLLDVEENSLPKVTKPRRARGPGMKVDRKMYGYGTSTKAVLYSGLHDASSPIRDESSREGLQFRLDYGVPRSVFQTIIKLLDDKFAPRSSMRKLRDILFELRVMACLRHLRLGGPMGRHVVGYSLDYCTFRKFFLEKILVWFWTIRHDFIKLPKTDDKINHVECLFRAWEHPSAVGSIDCVHIGWHKFHHTLKIQCTNTGAGDNRGKTSLVFQVVVPHTTKILSISHMHWGATNDSTIYTFDPAVHELMTGVYSTRQFTLWKYHTYKYIHIGMYYISDGGYPQMKYLIPPFKWTQVGTKKNIWYENVESTRKDVERCFGILKKIFRCLINPLELQDPTHIESLFNACTVIHNILLDYDGIDNWEARMRRATFSVNTSGKAGAQILHLPLGDDSSPSGDKAVGR
jgi:hypothetical protein